MSKTTSKMKTLLPFALVVVAGFPFLGPACLRRSKEVPVWRAIPGGTNWLGSRAGSGAARRWVTDGFSLAETEVTVGQFLAYLRAGGVAGFESPQFEQVDGVWRARVGLAQPVTHVTSGQAEGYATWLGGRLGREVRLPTEDEWEYAARAGVDGAPYPWGWEVPEGRALFAATGSVEVGRYTANRWGLRDMSGNVAEYCAGGVVRGGSWADRSPQPLRVFHRILLPANYLDADVGFRLLRE